MYFYDTIKSVPAPSTAGLTNGLSANKEPFFDRELVGCAGSRAPLVLVPLGAGAVLPVQIPLWRDSNRRTDGRRFLFTVCLFTAVT